MAILQSQRSTRRLLRRLLRVVGMYGAKTSSDDRSSSVWEQVTCMLGDKAMLSRTDIMAVSWRELFCMLGAYIETTTTMLGCTRCHLQHAIQGATVDWSIV